jgi:sugar/nucleoside kinase (ribokinase family)
VVKGQRLMQAHGDVLLGWHYFPDSSRPDYYIRQLRDWKGSLEVAGLDPAGLAMYAGYCAWTLARAHARSGDRVAIAAYLGGKDGFDQAIADFSAASPIRMNATSLASRGQQMLATFRYNGDYEW